MFLLIRVKSPKQKLNPIFILFALHCFFAGGICYDCFFIFWVDIYIYVEQYTHRCLTDIVLLCVIILTFAFLL